MPPPRPPFTPDRATFACPALLTLAAKAGLGGARETLLGAVMAARLAAGVRGPFALEASARQARAEGARQWLAAITLPPKARTALLRAFATTADGDPPGVADALEAVTEVTSPTSTARHVPSWCGSSRRSGPAGASLPGVPNVR